MPAAQDRAFHDGEQHNIPPPYTVGVSGGSCVRFYSSETGGSPLTGSGLMWGWKETDPDMFEEFAAPGQLWVEPYAAGTCNITLSLEINSPEECQGWPAERCATDTVKVTVVGVDLDIDNVVEEDEENPGGFVALNGSRKKIMLSVLPSTVGPVTFNVAPDTSVEIYAAPTGGEPLGNHLQYNTAAQVPTQLWVQGIAASYSLQDVELTLDAAPAGQHFTDTVRFTVVGLGHIQCEGQNVDGSTIVLLKGTIYTFTAIPQPAGAGWPVGLPSWSGLASGTGEQKQVTFDFSGSGYTLTAQYGNSKTVTIDVVVPSVDRIEYVSAGTGSQYDIYDKLNEWRANRAGQTGVSDPACYKMGLNTGVRVWFWHSSKDLTFATEVQVRGDVTWWEEDTTGGNYARTYMTLQALHSGPSGGQTMASEENCNAYIDYDYDVSTSWRYQVKSPQGTDEWIDTGDTDIRYYIILDQPQAPQALPWDPVLEKATYWAYEETTAEAAAAEVTEEVNDSGYEYDNVAGDARYEDTGQFDLTDCLNTWGDDDEPVNCWDCAQMVATFSNALGADLQTYYITRGPYVFLLNYIRPIGMGWTNDPFTAPGRQGFSCHWTGWGPEVYDACLEVDNDDDPTSSGHLEPLLPCNMTFNAGTPGTPYDDYRGKLVDPGHESSVGGVSVAPATVK